MMKSLACQGRNVSKAFCISKKTMSTADSDIGECHVIVSCEITTFNSRIRKIQDALISPSTTTWSRPLRPVYKVLVLCLIVSSDTVVL